MMEEFDDDDCSDLYADVLVQASSAISAMNRLTEIRHAEVKILDNVSECEEEEGEGGDGGLTILPLENDDISSEDDLDSGSDDGYKQKNDEIYKCNRPDVVEFGVINGNRREGGPEFEENEKRREGIDAKEQIKSLKYDSLSSKKSRVDEMAFNAHKSCKKRDEELFYKRDIEDNQSRPDNASASCRPVSLDKCGSLQISDSVEDSHHEVSIYSSDGTTMETSKDTKRRKQSSTYNKASSSVELESSDSDWSQRGRGSSCSPSPHVSLGDKVIRKSNKYSRHPSSSLDRELKYHSKDSKSRRGASDDTHCDRQRGVTWKHSHQPRKSSDVSCLKNRWTNGDASYAIDVRHPYTRNIKHGKQRAMASFKSNRNDMPYRSHSESFYTHSGRFLPDNRSGMAYLKNQYPNIQPSCRYKQGWPDDLNMNERQIFLEKKINKMDYEAPGDDWHHNYKRHLGQANIKGSRKLIPKYTSAVDQSGTQFSYEEDMQFRRREKDAYLPQLHESDNKFVDGKYRRMGPTSGQDRDHLISGRGKRRRDSSLNSSDNLCYTETDLNDRRNRNGRPFPFYSPSGGQYPESSITKFGVSERNMRCLWNEQHVENGRYGIDIATSNTIESLRYRHSEDHLVRRRHYQQYSDTYVMNESIKDDYDEDNFFRRRRHQHSEVHLREESRHQSDTMFHPEEPSYPFEKISRNYRDDDRRAFSHVEEHVDEREANRERNKMIREQDFSNQFDGYRKSIQPCTHALMHPKYQDSIDKLVVGGRKCSMQSSRRTPQAGSDKYYDPRDLIGWKGNQKSKKYEDLDNMHSENAVLIKEEKADICLVGKNQHDESLDIEEGQIISEEIPDLMKHVPPSEERQQPLDDEKIQEIMMKMERRKMRFKEPVIVCRDSSVKASYLLPDLNVESDMTKLERPLRKRRWSGT